MELVCTNNERSWDLARAVPIGIAPIGRPSRYFVETGREVVDGDVGGRAAVDFVDSIYQANRADSDGGGLPEARSLDDVLLVDHSKRLRLGKKHTAEMMASPSGTLLKW